MHTVYEIIHYFTWLIPRVCEQDAGVTVMVVTVASPKKALEFVEAQNELPLSTVFCSANLEAYKARYPNSV
jgi:hypothetical protein